MKKAISAAISFVAAIQSPLLAQQSAPAPVDNDLTGPKPPNVILVLNNYSSPMDDSEALKRLAQTGIVFEKTHLNPTRSANQASILTGRYNIRTKCLGSGNGWSMVATDEVTLAEAMSGAGYATGYFGDWQIGNHYPMRPSDQGFESSLTIPSGIRPFDPSEQSTIWLKNNYEVSNKSTPLEISFKEANKFIDRSLVKHRPFLCTIAPPISKSKETIDALNTQLTNLTGFLSEKGIQENTILVILSYKEDSSGLISKPSSTSLIINWPAQIKTPQNIANRPAAHIDIMPTIMEACDLGTPDAFGFDGIDLLAKSDKLTERPIVIQESTANTPVDSKNFQLFKGEWILLNKGDENLELYNISTDPSLNNNQASSNPAKLNELQDIYKKWFNDVTYTRIRDRGPADILISRTDENPVVLTMADKISISAKAPATEAGYWNTSFEHSGRFDVCIPTQSLPEQDIKGWKVSLLIGKSAINLDLQSLKSPTIFRGITIPKGKQTIRAKFISPDESKIIPAPQVELIHR